MRWTTWIHEGPADGQRRQHHFSRTVKGWTPIAMSSGIVNDVDQEDELEDLEKGVSMEELNQVRFDQAAKRHTRHGTAGGR